MEKKVKESIQTRRFAFGKNWCNYIKTVNDEKIFEAEDSLKMALNVDSLKGKSFLDIGSGSGLFSLAAKRLGAKVFSFDYDPESVNCTKQLKETFFPEDPNWVIEEASVLDAAYLENIGKHDIVYSWGVLHHTGSMWLALENVLIPLKEKGKLILAIYNDQGLTSWKWLQVKKMYCSSFFEKIIVLSVFFPYFILRTILVGFVKYRNPIKIISMYKKKRGMSIWHDMIDWIGGYPFEVAKPEDIYEFYQKKGLCMLKMHTTNRLGCNEFVFIKVNCSIAASIE